MTKLRTNSPIWLCSIFLTLSLAIANNATRALGSDIEGFTEPYRVINVAAAEIGILTKIEVREGDAVGEKQILARLNDGVLRASLRIAEAGMKSQGQLNSANAELRLKTDRLEKLKELRISDNASQQEVDRAGTEVEISQSRVLAAEEALLVKKLEFERIEVQLEQRIMRSPINGVVTEIFKDIAEHVSPTDPIVMTVVQLDPLYATFSVSSSEAEALKREQSVRVSIGSKRSKVQGIVEFISPVTNAESGTVRVKVRLPNSKGEHRSGERCILILNKNHIPRLSQSKK